MIRPVPHATVLTVSRDEIIRYSRDEILRQAGYNVFSTSTDSEAVALVQREAVDAVVLCDSIPYDERNTLVRAIKKVKPGVCILVVRLTCEPVAHEADTFMNSLDGAKTMLTLIEQMLNRDMRQSA